MDTRPVGCLLPHTKQTFLSTVSPPHTVFYLLFYTIFRLNSRNPPTNRKFCVVISIRSENSFFFCALLFQLHIVFGQFSNRGHQARQALDLGRDDDLSGLAVGRLAESLQALDGDDLLGRGRLV